MREFAFGMIGGVALLLLGITMMGQGLERAAGNALRKIVDFLTTNLFLGVAVGTVVTSIIQSSSAVTVLAVGFVNAGLMTLKQALGVIYGANIGTTMTAQLMRLKITDYALPIIAIGVVVNLAAQKDRYKNIGSAIIGFGLLFLGLKTLGSGTEYVRTNPWIKDIIIKYTSNPLSAVAIGAFVTAIIQSSSASTGIVIALAQVGLLDFRSAAGIVLGNNIGTCVTALLASIHADLSARRTAYAHVFFNISGVLITLPFFNYLILFIQNSSTNITGQIANLHTTFNLLTTLLFIPFTDLFVKFLYKLVPEEKGKLSYGPRYLNKSLISTPEAALAVLYKELQHCHEVATLMVQQIFKSVFENEEIVLNNILKEEEILNNLQTEVIQYVVLLSKENLDSIQSQQLPSILHIVGDAERIGDHTKDLTEQAREKSEEKIFFTEEATKELKLIQTEMAALAALALTSLKNPETNSETFQQTIVLEREIKNLTEKGRNGHIERLENGNCTVRAGILYMDILSHLERISEHYANMVRRGSYDNLQMP
ncbi:MAG TPA: Na/Pi cotransporter family protein [Bacillota bacterium]|nr:Na/Pi cotransporter family protein [Bacillota bacterium]